eukprot:COSAG02_NODE_7276_length_3087_cov_4.386546_4_plen_58_part_00
MGKRIAVKWASKAGKNFIMTAGKTGPSEFYSGKVMAWEGIEEHSCTEEEGGTEEEEG